jgi:DMSO/TMAO reductase YedYZ heme-binding membrane subunit
MMNQTWTRTELFPPSLKQSFGVFAGSLLLALIVAVVFGTMAVNAFGAKASWYLVRSSGTVGYLLLAGSTIWGLVLSTQVAKKLVPGAPALAMHSALSWLAVFTAGAHALLLLFDNYYTYGLLDVLLPFTGPYRPFWVGLGILGLYLALLTSLSFQWRRQLGMGRWRKLHKLTFVSYAFVTLHGLMAGTDSALPGMRLVYIGSALLVLLLTNYRLLAASR